MPHSDTSSFIQTTDNGNALRLAGDWTLANYSALRAQLTELPHAPERTASVDISAISSMDTAGGQLMADLLGHSRLQQLVEQDQSLSSERRALLQRLATHLGKTVV